MAVMDEIPEMCVEILADFIRTQIAACAEDAAVSLFVHSSSCLVLGTPTARDVCGHPRGHKCEVVCMAAFLVAPCCAKLAGRGALGGNILFFDHHLKSAQNGMRYPEMAKKKLKSKKKKLLFYS